ncbi:MAG: OmpA family protein [Verrucomicrobia bacterium]|nr:OmpA family protein [Verrucomicrobiota bacterium]
MPVQYGQCLNKAGCSLAYTGEMIRYEGEARCPECGQPLGPAAPRRKKPPWLSGLIVLAILVAASIAFLVWQRRSQEPSHAAPLPAIVGEPDQNHAPAVVDGNTTSLPEIPKPPVTGSSPAPGGTPANVVNERSESAGATPPVSASPPAGPVLSASPAAEESVVTKPPTLSAQQVDTTRADVLKRINAMPRMSAQEKDRLSQKVESAHGMERLRIVHFDLGKTTLSRSTADQLARSFTAGDTKEKLADPTLVLVIAGYADSGGDPGVNLRISQDRADGVSRLLKKAGILNVMHTVAMGSTDLLDGKRPEQNRAVEIWAVVP